jgi:hypothetical protein
LRSNNDLASCSLIKNALRTLKSSFSRAPQRRTGRFIVCGSIRRKWSVANRLPPVENPKLSISLAGRGACEPDNFNGHASMNYHSTKDLCGRFRCSSRTLFRWMRRAENPLPAPCIRHSGSCNLWDADEIAAWEARERAFTRAMSEARSDQSVGIRL